MPAGQGEDAERFAAAAEQGTPPGFADDDDLARELEIVAMLRSAGPAFTPGPDAKARARQRLMAIVAEQGEQHRGGGDPGTQHSQVAPPTAEETTAPMGRVAEPPFPTPRREIDATAETAQLPPVTPDGLTAEDPDEAETTGPTNRTSPRAGRSGHRSRHSVASRPAGRARSSRRPAPSLRRRATLVGAAALVAMLALTGGGLMASRDALPGDSLYALKRVAESAELALTFDEAARAERHLQIAATRLSEVEQLIARNPEAADPAVYSAAIQEFDTATDEGSRVLLSAAETNRDTARLDSLHAWVTQQAARLSELRAALPVPAAVNADGSIKLLDQLLGRTEAMGARSNCSEAGAGDQPLGPVPAQGQCTPRSVNQTGPDAPDSPLSGTPGTRPEIPAPSSGQHPSGTPSTTPDEGAPGLLPDLTPNGSLAPGSSEGESAPDRSDSPHESSQKEPGGGEVNVPVPLLPPVTLPPLLPGMPPITIG